ncbi:MAG TPA: hypothetical protein VFY12_12280 [Arenimonas sp.]|nr:hypothetical protein [Arenimonas sp.]
MTSDLAQSQSDMRAGYCSGGAGVLASALAWLAAAIATLQLSPQQAVWVLFVGGMAIHPAGVLFCKVLGRSGGHSKGNPLGSLAGATTMWLIFSLPLAFAASMQRIEWFFPAMLLVIGGRYLTFHTLFGLRVYWLLGLALAAAGWVLGMSLTTPTLAAFVGSGIEAMFAVYIIISDRRSSHLQESVLTELAEGAGVRQ